MHTLHSSRRNFFHKNSATIKRKRMGCCALRYRRCPLQALAALCSMPVTTPPLSHLSRLPQVAPRARMTSPSAVLL